ncbi:MAG: hypothetical protein OEV49_16460 [candidate division Zixibacteria bacterium]|nr:hypothetical protein [candidate division Zixibacteria bacterium]MDH3936942.1 hypothetical protein [candidate division Zixibacteria bacterium]MDH4033914.1 hypothetical protein [candidate division Zixibacteria bacterium]
MKRKVKSPVFYVVVICTFHLLAGCGSQYSKVRLDYYLRTPPSSSIPNAAQVSVFVERFTDLRTGVAHNVIGEAKTGIADKKSPIIIDDSLVELSALAFRGAFAESGFNVVFDEAEADLVFKGRINVFWVQEFTPGLVPQHSEADIEFDVVLIDRIHDVNLWYDVKKSHVESILDGMDVTVQNEQIINRALYDVIASVLKDDQLAVAVGKFVEQNK